MSHDWYKPQPPSDLMTDDPSVCVTINKKWIPHILGAVLGLAREAHWGGSDAENYAASQQVQVLIESMQFGSDKCMIPIGGILIWPDDEIPANYLLCDGSAVNEDDYPELFAVLVTRYGVGGAGTFLLPNLIHRVPIGAGEFESFNYTAGTPGGARTVTLTESQIPAHSHQLLVKSSSAAGSTQRVMQSSGAGTNTSVQTEDSGGGGSHNNMPPYLVMNYIIRAM